ncbi:MAG: phosphate ABC transporter phosphate-binding protein, partial [Oscillospiraceae bacterium]
MKKLAALTLAAVLCLSTAACAPKDPAAGPSDPAVTAGADEALTGTVSTNGSTSMEKVIGALMEQ